MEQNIYIALKSQIEKYTTLADIEWEEFKTHWQYKEVSKDEYLLKAGQVENYFYFMSSGVIRLFADRNDQEVNAGFTYDGDFSGVYDSFLSRQPSEMYLQAITDCAVLRINYENMMDMYDRYKSIERFGRLFNADMLILMARRQIESRSFSAEERLQRLLDQSPHIFRLIPLKHLSSYLGMTPETLSRLRKKLATGN